jgi:acetyl esterase/lipase
MFIDFWAPRNEIWADFLNSPNAKTFWKDVPAEKVLITIGGFEAFRDDVVDMAGVLKATMGEKLELVVAEGEVHVQCVVDVVLGMRPGRSHGAMLEWCKRL